jgi:hypothetical protein
MGKVRRVLGDVDSKDLGIVDAHEHLIRTGGLEILKNGEDWRLNDVSKAIEEVKLFAQAGGKTIVDMNPISNGRDVQKLVEIAKAVPEVHIMTCTGFHEGRIYDNVIHWSATYEVNRIVDLRWLPNRGRNRYLRLQRSVRGTQFCQSQLHQDRHRLWLDHTRRRKIDQSRRTGPTGNRSTHQHPYFRRNHGLRTSRAIDPLRRETGSCKGKKSSLVCPSANPDCLVVPLSQEIAQSQSLGAKPDNISCMTGSLPTFSYLTKVYLAVCPTRASMLIPKNDRAVEVVGQSRVYMGGFKSAGYYQKKKHSASATMPGAPKAEPTHNNLAGVAPAY